MQQRAEQPVKRFARTFCRPCAVIIGCAALLIPPYQAAIATPETPNLETMQGYLDPAPGGMDVRYAWTLEGGRGENVRIIDIEVDWNLNHAELRAVGANLIVYERGTDPQPDDNINHGTAVLGELVAADDAAGVTGIANRARLGLLNPIRAGGVTDVAAAVNRAAEVLSPGDVILIEQQMIGPRFDISTGRGTIPTEFDPAVFNAISAATIKGIVVVEAAANGFDNLDHSGYNGAFDRRIRDSGAIIVGAGMPPAGQYGPGPDRERWPDSNWGSRVDVQGWARSVATCGYGNLQREQGEDNWYTDRFGGTSGAAAMVAGAAAVIEGIVKARSLPPLKPEQLRELLVSTGTPQTGNLGENIGPRPDLRAAIAALDTAQTGLPPRITSVGFNANKGKLVVDGERFIPADSVIEINTARIPKVKYPSEFWLPNGTTTRLVSKGDLSLILPRGVTVSITVFTPSTGKRSDPVSFRWE
ncbi:MAG TPA: S8 family serine peptidase [Blastocatellia bacterium]|nr:S8 family serine peptidase [Blastocatellia bacterium]